MVGEASTGAEALRLVNDLRPDVTLVDINLGGESGFELAEQLHWDPRATLSPVILISTYAEQDIAEMIAESAAVGYVYKSSLSPDAIRDLLLAGANTSLPTIHSACCAELLAESGCARRR